MRYYALPYIYPHHETARQVTNTFNKNRHFHSGIADFYKHKLIAMDMVTIANIITAGRILISLLILFFPAFSPMFYAFYCFTFGYC